MMRTRLDARLGRVILTGVLPLCARSAFRNPQCVQLIRLRSIDSQHPALSFTASAGQGATGTGGQSGATYQLGMARFSSFSFFSRS
jgi:hypothetical protein